MGLPDGKSIRHSPIYFWKNMGNLQTSQAQDAKLEKEDAPTQAHADEKYKASFQLDGFKKVTKPGCLTKCLEFLFIVLCIICMLKSFAEIIVTGCTAFSTKLYSSEQSERLVAMVLLAMLAALTISILAYALIAVCRKQQKPLHVATLVLLLTAILQAVIVGVAVRITLHDEQVLVRSLEESFGLAKERNSRHVQLWAATQSEMNCCGLYSPEDYRSINLPEIFPPNVPISCCTTYDSSRSDLVQERERETCKARRMYYEAGCKKLVVDSVEAAADLVLGLTSSLIVLEIILAILALILLKKIRRLKNQQSDGKEDNA